MIPTVIGALQTVTTRYNKFLSDLGTELSFDFTIQKEQQACILRKALTKEDQRMKNTDSQTVDRVGDVVHWMLLGPNRNI